VNKSSKSKQMGNLPTAKDNARQAKLDEASSPEGARKAGKRNFLRCTKMMDVPLRSLKIRKIKWIEVLCQNK